MLSRYSIFCSNKTGNLKETIIFFLTLFEIDNSILIHYLLLFHYFHLIWVTMDKFKFITYFNLNIYRWIVEVETKILQFSKFQILVTFVEEKLLTNIINNYLAWNTEWSRDETWEEVCRGLYVQLMSGIYSYFF